MIWDFRASETLVVNSSKGDLYLLPLFIFFIRFHLIGERSASLIIISSKNIHHSILVLFTDQLVQKRARTLAFITNHKHVFCLCLNFLKLDWLAQMRHHDQRRRQSLQKVFLKLNSLLRIRIWISNLFILLNQPFKVFVLRIVTKNLRIIIFLQKIIV